jgi:chloramphenicol-sensitive protein RarD
VSEGRLGALFALLAYGAWGVVPLYWREVSRVDALVVLAHRVVWSVLFVTLFLAARGRLSEALRVLISPRHLRLLVPSGLLIAFNWAIFIGAVLSGELAAASLGYFLNPLANVALGVALLGETLRPLGKLAVGFALAGAVVLVVAGGGLVVPLSLALSSCPCQRAP